MNEQRKAWWDGVLETKDLWTYEEAIAIKQAIDDALAEFCEEDNSEQDPRPQC